MSDLDDRLRRYYAVVPDSGRQSEQHRDPLTGHPVSVGSPKVQHGRQEDEQAAEEDEAWPIDSCRQQSARQERDIDQVIRASTPRVRHTERQHQLQPFRCRCMRMVQDERMRAEQQQYDRPLSHSHAVGCQEPGQQYDRRQHGNTRSAQRTRQAAAQGTQRMPSDRQAVEVEREGARPWIQRDPGKRLLKSLRAAAQQLDTMTGQHAVGGKRLGVERSRTA